MSKFDRKKIAVTLAFASLFGSKTSAANASKNGVKIPQSLGAVRGGKKCQKLLPNQANSNKNLKSIKGLSALEKVLIGFGITVGTGVLANEAAAGITWAMGKESNSIFEGQYSITNFFRDKTKKDDENPGGSSKDAKEQKKDDDKPNPEKLEDKKENENVDKQKKLDAILTKFKASDEKKYSMQKDKLTEFCNDILDGRYEYGDDFSEEYKVAVNKILSFIENPDDSTIGFQLIKTDKVFFIFQLAGYQYGFALYLFSKDPQSKWSIVYLGRNSNGKWDLCRILQTKCEKE